jgi:hypothetical protein
VEDDDARAEIVRALVTVARALGREVIAGCAERQSTVDLLPRLGIDLAQGHCLGRPTPELARDGRSFMVGDRREADLREAGRREADRREAGRREADRREADLSRSDAFPLPPLAGPACRLDPLVA